MHDLLQRVQVQQIAAILCVMGKKSQEENEVRKRGAYSSVYIVDRQRGKEFVMEIYRVENHGLYVVW